MKTKPYFVITLFAFFTLTVLPRGFVQAALPQPSVQLVYFLPNNRAPHPNIDAKIDGLIKDVQDFYANEMERHGFGRKTFRLETSANGKARVHHINGQFNSAYYNAEDGAFEEILSEIGERFDTSQNIYFIVADVTFPSAYWRGGGQAYLGSHTIVYIPFDEDFVTFYHAGHELAHSFGLQHDFRYRSKISEADITSYMVGVDFNNQRLSRCAAEWLDVHPYFNPNQTSFNEPPTVQMLPPLAYPPNAISLRFNVTDPDGLHQAQLVTPRESGFSLHSCQSLNGQRSSIVEFITTELTATTNDEVALGIIDVHGNFSWTSYFIQIDGIERVDGVINVNNSASDVLRKVSGDNQHGYLNSRLINPFVVTVRDTDEEPVAGVQVIFQVAAGEGTLSITNPWTDSEGQAQTFLTLGNSQEKYHVTASVDGIADQVIFTALINKEAVATGTPLKTLRGHRDNVFSVAYSPDGNLIATGSLDGTIRLWDGITGQEKKILGEHVDLWEVYSVAFSPDGLTLASGNRDGTVRLWDVETGNHKLKFDGRSYTVLVVAYSPDGSKIASGTLTGEIHVWDAVTGEYKTSFTGHPGSNVVSLSFNRKGTLLASGGSDRIIRLWDVVTGQQLETITEHGDGVKVVFSHDSSELASTGAWDLTARLWDATGQHLKTFTGHTSGVYPVAFSHDNRTLATGSYDGEIRLWDTVTGLTKKILIGHTDTVRSLAFSPNGGMLVSGSNDHTVNLWEFTSTFSQEPIDDSDKVTISEIMIASNGGQLPQWIELYNSSDTHVVNLRAWRLEIQNRRSMNFNGRINATFTFKGKVINPQETLLIVSKQGRSSNHFRKRQIYDLNTLHPNLQDTLLSEEGFYIKLSSAAGELIDEVGNLDAKRNTDDKPTWHLPRSLTEDGARVSIVRRHDDGIPRFGTEVSSWVSAINTKLPTGATTYYGHPDDIGAPGVRSGGALPVTLSHFRAELTDAGVMLNWTTESEVDNAGFYILRSETKDGEFKVVNPQLIQGAGTTSERHDYTWKDTTAKPNVAYYYQIEDISHAGVRKKLATVRMKGLVSASGKLTTRWADLKLQE